MDPETTCIRTLKTRVPILYPIRPPPYKQAGGICSSLHWILSWSTSDRPFFVHTTLPCLAMGILIKFYAVIGLFCLILTFWSCIMLRAITHLFITHPQIQNRENYTKDSSLSIIHQDIPVSKDNPCTTSGRSLLTLESSFQRPPSSLDIVR